MPNISASPFADMNAFWPCIPDDVRVRYAQGPAPAAYQFQTAPWAWAVCHSGEWLYHGNRYVWVSGRRHHHPPCHWAKSGHTVVLVPTHPRDAKNQPPVNQINPVLAVNLKGPHPIERLELDRHAPVAVMKEPPREFRAGFVHPLAPAAEPLMAAHRVQDAAVTKGQPVRTGTPITFNPRMQSFMMVQQQMHAGRSVSVSAPMNNHSGNLQGRGSVGSVGSGARGGAGAGSAARGGGSGGGSHGGSSGSSSGGSGSGSSGASGSSGGGSHH